MIAVPAVVMKIIVNIIAQLMEVIVMLQDILDLLTRIDTALGAIGTKLANLSGGLTAAEATQIRDAVTVIAQKAEQLAQ